MDQLRNAINGVINAGLPLENLATGGQPSVHHLEALAAADCAVVLDLRDPMEPRGFDERALVEQLGMRYVNHPVHSGSMNDDTLDRLVAELRALAGRKAFLHCASGNRVGAALIPILMLDLGYDDDAAVTAAMGVGLRSAELLEWAVDYTRRKAAEPTEADL